MRRGFCVWEIGWGAGSSFFCRFNPISAKSVRYPKTARSGLRRAVGFGKFRGGLDGFDTENLRRGAKDTGRNFAGGNRRLHPFRKRRLIAGSGGGRGGRDPRGALPSLCREKKIAAGDGGDPAGGHGRGHRNRRKPGGGRMGGFGGGLPLFFYGAPSNRNISGL